MVESLVCRTWDMLRRQPPKHRHLVQNAYDDTCGKEIIRRAVGEYSNCIDAGANQGTFLKLMVKYAPRGHHHAFEPIPELAEALREQYPGVRVWGAALGEEACRAEFLQFMSDPGMSGFRRLHYYGQAGEIRKIVVQVLRLDDVLARDFKVDLLKVDVEGAEYRVFQGARRTLQHSKPAILFEFFRDWSAAFGTNPRMIYRLLAEDCGLQIWLPDEWLLGRPQLTLGRLERIWRNGMRQNFLACGAVNQTPIEPKALLA